MFVYLFDDGPLVGETVTSANRETAGAMFDVEVVDVEHHPHGSVPLPVQGRGRRWRLGSKPGRATRTSDATALLLN